MTYIAPVKDMLFVMNELAGLSDIIAYPRFSALGINAELIPQLLEKAAKNKKRPKTLIFKDPQDLPKLVTTACNEIEDGYDSLISSCGNIALIDRIYQKCIHHTKRHLDDRPIKEFSDEAHKLITIRSLCESLRALDYYSASLHDAMTSTANSHTIGVNRAIYEFVTPINQGFSTEFALEAATIGAQIHKCWNFSPEIELSKISANDVSVYIHDLVMNKTIRDGGVVGRVLIRKIEKTEADLKDSASLNALVILKYLSMGREALQMAIECLVKNVKTESDIGYRSGKAYLQICGIVLSAWQMARAVLAAERLHDDDNYFYETKIITASFFMANILPRVQALLTSLTEGISISDISDHQ